VRPTPSWSHVRALKAHSASTASGRRSSGQLFAENPGEVEVGGANLRKQVRELPALRRSRGGGHQRHPRTTRQSTPPSPDRRGVGRPLRRPHQLRGRRRGAVGSWPGAVAAAATRRATSGCSTRRCEPGGEGRRVAIPGCTGPMASPTKRPSGSFASASGTDRRFPVCIARPAEPLVQSKLKGPHGWTSHPGGADRGGAGFVYLRSGEMRTCPAAERPGRRARRHRRVGNIVGLF